jgi:hypothetical protein
VSPLGYIAVSVILSQGEEEASASAAGSQVHMSLACSSLLHPFEPKRSSVCTHLTQALISRGGYACDDVNRKP